jgi:trimethylamine---corrinoid protein Co-methyltransferase
LTTSRTILKQLHDATLMVLERTGVGLDNDEALALLADSGVRVDFVARRVYPTGNHIKRALSTMPRNMTIHGWGHHPPVALAQGNVSILSGGGNLRVLTLDGCYEPATWEHLRQFNRLLDALPNIHMCINQVDPVEDTGEGFYRRLAGQMLIGCPKPICFQAASAADVSAMLTMGTAIRGSTQDLQQRPIFMLGLNSEPPLHISEDVAGALIAGCRAGIPCSMGCYVMMGVTSPVTVAGSAVHINAVQLTSFLLSQLVRPGAPMCYTSFSGSSDLRTLENVSGNPHATQLVQMTTALGSFYGLPVYGTAVTDAKAADPQAACERAVQLQVAVEAGASLIQGPTAHMDQFMLTSFAQAVIDNDIVGYVLATNRPITVDTETLALEASHEVITEPEFSDMKFAAHPHTTAFMRSVMWQPRTFFSASFSKWQQAGSQSVVERATEIAREILHHHHPEQLPADVIAEIERIQ